MATPKQQHVWVTQGKTKHDALLFPNDDVGEGMARVKWSNGAFDVVSIADVDFDFDKPRESRRCKRQKVSESEGVHVRVKAEDRNSAPIPASTKADSGATKQEEDTSAIVTPERSASPVRRASEMSKRDKVIKVTMEQFEAKLKANPSAEEHKEREDLRARRLESNIDHATGEGRAVFRRGCHPQCITKVLGGSGMHPSPTVKEAPLINGNANPFIRDGEFYMAGRADWNPWVPTFCGDNGLVAQWFIDEEALKQEHFHLFTQCSKKRHEQHYHGPNAKGKYLYTGIYRIVPHEDGAELQATGETILYSNVGEESKHAMAKQFRKHDSFLTWSAGKNQVKSASAANIELRHFERAEEAADEDRPGKWDAMSGEDREIEAWIEMLVERGFKIEVVPVECVGYDEGLYQALLSNGADNGRVSIVENELGPM